jgi:stage II sporulation protein D
MFPVLVLAVALATAQPAAPGRVDSVTLVPAAGTTLSMGRGAYAGQLDITAYPDGLAAVETTSIDRYLLGITEVPTSWPDETLAAQVVAARTYLAWTLARGRTVNGARYDYDICASQYCQVYRGPGGAAESWTAAVARTSGQILLHDGRPAQALYSSSAGSRTRAVQDVFGGTALPYLQPVDSPEMEVTPFPRWEISVTDDQFSRVFARGGYSFGDEIRDVRIRSAGEGEGQVAIEVQTEQGVTVIPVTRFRAVFNVYGPDLYPGLMPAARPSGGRWPQTILSYTFDVGYTAPTGVAKALLPIGEAGAPGRLVIVGQGWGHGVGMSQYGALALGGAGTSYESILEHYYGLRPRDGSAALPETVRVGLLVEQPEVLVVADGPFSLVSDEYGVVPVRAGEWAFRRSGDGLIILAPEGAVYDSPLLRLQRFRPR